MKKKKSVVVELEVSGYIKTTLNYHKTFPTRALDRGDCINLEMDPIIHLSQADTGRSISDVCCDRIVVKVKLVDI
jgi:hypothetical protein